MIYGKVRRVISELISIIVTGLIIIKVKDRVISRIFWGVVNGIVNSV